MAKATVEVSPDTRIAVLTEPRGPAADRYRFLRMRLHELRVKAKLQSVAITSPLPQDGKSTVALNLATALARHGKRSVLLIEADLHHPTLVGRLRLSERPGLAECLEGDVDPISVITRLEPLNWCLIAAGKPQGNPTELLQSAGLPRVLNAVSPHFDWVLVDTPPVAPLSDALAVSRQTDATLLVVRAHRTPCEAVEEAVSLLEPSRIAGIVLNAAEDLHGLYYKYPNYYAKK